MTTTAQIRTNENDVTDNNNGQNKLELRNLQHEQWITFVALGGLVTEESESADRSNNIRQMPTTEFSTLIGVPRRTLYDWKKSIPDFGERVRQRRYELFSLSRETQLFNRAYLIAMTSKDHKSAVEAIKLLLGHFSMLDLPIQRQEIKNDGESWSTLVERKQREVLEGEIVNDPQVHEHDRPTNN
jgi:hypothetical protein